MASLTDFKNNPVASTGDVSIKPNHSELSGEPCEGFNGNSEGVQDERPRGPYERYLMSIRHLLPWVDHILRYMHSQAKQYRLATTPESSSILFADFRSEDGLECYSMSDIEHISSTIHGNEKQQPLCRLIIAEDLSPRMIEYLGSTLQLDPRVFHEHLIECDDTHLSKAGLFSRQFGEPLLPFFDTRNFSTNLEEFRSEKGFSCPKDTLSVSLPYDSFAVISDTANFREKHPRNTLDIAKYYLYQDQPRSYLQSQRFATSRAYNCQLPDNCRPLRFNSYKQITVHRVSNSKLTVPTCTC